MLGNAENTNIIRHVKNVQRKCIH